MSKEVDSSIEALSKQLLHSNQFLQILTRQFMPFEFINPGLQQFFFPLPKKGFLL